MDTANYEQSKRIFLIGLEIVLRKKGFEEVVTILKRVFHEDSFQEHLTIMNENNYQNIILDLKNSSSI